MDCTVCRDAEAAYTAAVAGLTSEDAPLYYVLEEYNTYAVIGGVAYLLKNNPPSKIPAYLDLVYPGTSEPIVIGIPDIK